MKFSSDYLLNLVPFLVVTKKGTVGAVVDVSCPKGGASKITLQIQESREQLDILFPRDSCTPYTGDIIEIQYRHCMFLFFRPYNTVSYWSRKRSQIQEVHNTVAAHKPEILLGALLH